MKRNRNKVHKIIKQASNGLSGSVAFNMPTHAQFVRRAVLTRKVGQTGLVLGIWSGFVSRSAHERLQVSVCSGHDFCHSG